MKTFVGGIDQGTTSTRFLLFDKDGNTEAVHQVQHSQIIQQPGWCEHNPDEILEAVVQCIDAVVAKTGIQKHQVGHSFADDFFRVKSQSFCSFDRIVLL